MNKNKLPRTVEELLPLTVDVIATLFSAIDGNAFHQPSGQFKNWMEQYNDEACDILFHGVESFLKNNPHYNRGVNKTPTELKKLLKTIKVIKHNAKAQKTT